MSDRPKFRAPHLPQFYLQVFPALVATAREHGYALAVHGSCIRDLDLIAVPWVDVASDATTLMRALRQTSKGITSSEDFDELVPNCDPKEKPHGRVACSLHFTNRGCEGPYVDVSVMPCRATQEATP